jgi:hypothetical protein
MSSCPFTRPFFMLNRSMDLDEIWRRMFYTKSLGANLIFPRIGKGNIYSSGPSDVNASKTGLGYVCSKITSSQMSCQYHKKRSSLC